MMSIFFTVLLYIFIFILFLLLLLFLLPLQFHLLLSYASSFQAHGSAGFGKWFRVVFRIDPAGKSARFYWAGLAFPERKKNRPGRYARQPEKIRKAHALRFSRIKRLAGVLDRAFLHQLIRLGKKLLHLTKLHTFRLEGKIGFREPHYTGCLMGVLALLNGLFPGAAIHLEPVWDELCAELHLTMAGSLNLLFVTVVLAKFWSYRSVRDKIKLLRTAAA